MLRTPVLVASVVVFVSYVTSEPVNSKQRKWDGLKVTWDVDPMSCRAFDSLPRTATLASLLGFKKISDCDAKSVFQGARYVKNGDYAVVLLYDVNGYIAGMQAGVPKGLINNFPNPELMPPFVEEGDYYYMTAYFVDPATICSGGRSKEMAWRDGTGTDLYIHNGTNSVSDLLRIPNKESGVAATLWTKGKCFPTMGIHYWYNTNKDMDCKNFFPMFLLYNSGELTAFGWAFNADLSSDRFEHPNPAVFGTFFNPVPDCLYKQGKFSTMHIYLTQHPELYNC